MRRLAVLAPLLVFLGVYLPRAGHGFIQDDYGWVYGNRVRSFVIAGAVWLVVGLAFAYVLPVRSDLYAAMPAVGSSLIVAALTSWMWSGASAAAQRRALVVATVAALALAPIYWVRTERMVRVAGFSTARLDELVAATRDLPSGSRVRVDDVASTDPRSPNLEAAFGVGVGEALSLRAGRPIDAVLVTPRSPSAGPFDRRFRWDGRTLADAGR